MKYFIVCNALTVFDNEVYPKMSAAMVSPAATSSTPCNKHNGRLTRTAVSYITNELESRYLEMDKVVKFLRTTDAVITGGAATNAIVASFGHTDHVTSLPNKSDIDFMVFSPMAPRTVPTAEQWRAAYESADGAFKVPEVAKYRAEMALARTMRNMVIAQFEEVMKPAGYVRSWAHSMEEYLPEVTTAGDRLFTTGSKVKYSVIYYTKTLPDGTELTTNLVFVNESLHEAMTKVDISLTAGFITSHYGKTWHYEHAYPDDVEKLVVCWSQPEATHTDRQYARMVKYGARYGVNPRFTLTPDEFIAVYDKLPEMCDITLKVAEGYEMPLAVLRRIRGLGAFSGVIVATDAG